MATDMYAPSSHSVSPVGIESAESEVAIPFARRCGSFRRGLGVFFWSWFSPLVRLGGAIGSPSAAVLRESDESGYAVMELKMKLTVDFPVEYATVVWRALLLLR